MCQCKRTLGKGLEDEETGPTKCNKAVHDLNRRIYSVARKTCSAAYAKWGCGVKLGQVYAAIPRLSLYSMGLSEPRDILIRFSLYQRI